MALVDKKVIAKDGRSYIELSFANDGSGDPNEVIFARIAVDPQQGLGGADLEKVGLRRIRDVTAAALRAIPRSQGQGD